MDLHGLDLEALPSKVYELADLTSLLARHNQLKCAPEQLTISVSPKLLQLQSLTILELSWNQLKAVPPPIFELKLLESLVLNNNDLEVLDPRIGNLGHTLKTLHLGVNKLVSFPKEIGHLTALNSLIAPNNNISELPDSMADMISLDDIYLRYNNLTTIPKALCSLKRLSIISVEDNRIVSLPDPADLPAVQLLHSVPQEVLPGIFIGSSSTSKNRRSLALFGLTHHVALTDPIGDSQAPECNVSDHYFQDRLLLQISDVEAQPLDEAIRQCSTFIENAVLRGHKILINSTLGVSRSAAIICAYMIKNMHVTYDEAISRLRTVRGNVKPNAGFERQLRLYEQTMLAAH